MSFFCRLSRSHSRIWPIPTLGDLLSVKAWAFSDLVRVNAFIEFWEAIGQEKPLEGLLNLSLPDNIDRFHLLHPTCIPLYITSTSHCPRLYVLMAMAMSLYVVECDFPGGINTKGEAIGICRHSIRTGMTISFITWPTLASNAACTHLSKWKYCGICIFNEKCNKNFKI